MTSGVISGPGVLTVDDTMQWTGGIVSGILDIASAGTLTFSNAGNWKYLSSLTLSNAGTIVWNNGPLALQDGSTIFNRAGALFDIQAGNAIQTEDNADTTTSTLYNAGTFRLEPGSGTTTFNGSPWGTTAVALLNNTGTVDIEGGVLSLPTIFTQSAGATLKFGVGQTGSGNGYGQLQVPALSIAGKLALSVGPNASSIPSATIISDNGTSSGQFQGLAQGGTIDPGGISSRSIIQAAGAPMWFSLP